MNGKCEDLIKITLNKEGGIKTGSRYRETCRKDENKEYDDIITMVAVFLKYRRYIGNEIKY